VLEWQKSYLVGLLRDWVSSQLPYRTIEINFSIMTTNAYHRAYGWTDWVTRKRWKLSGEMGRDNIFLDDIRKGFCTCHIIRETCVARILPW